MSEGMGGWLGAGTKNCVLTRCNFGGGNF